MLDGRKQIIEAEADYVLALKGNQDSLHRAVIDYILEQWEADFAGVKARRYETQYVGHGCQETRTYLQMPVPENLPGRDAWAGMKSIGVVISECVRDGKVTDEVRYYISSLAVGVKRFAHAVRFALDRGKHMSLEPEHHLSGGRIARAAQAPGREHVVAIPVYALTAKATSGATKLGDETAVLWLGREIPAGSPCRNQDLVGAGPGIHRHAKPCHSHVLRAINAACRVRTISAPCI